MSDDATRCGVPRAASPTFDRYGFDRTRHDIAWQGGVTYSF